MSSEQQLSTDEPLVKLDPPYYPDESSSSAFYGAPGLASAPVKAFLSLPETPYISSRYSTSALSLHSHAPSILSARSQSPFPGRPSLWARCKSTLDNNRGIMLVLLSQFFGSLMSLTTRILETGYPEQRFHPLQILFVRQSITSVLVFVWMWRMKVENAPFGPRGVRGLLIARGVGGFFGVFGLYYSLSYLDLSDATVITFLAPIVATFACSLIPSLREPFTSTNLFASIFSLAGVVLIARPATLFHSGNDHDDTAVLPDQVRRAILQPSDTESVTPHQRLVAVLVALLGVLGAASAFTTIRWIGQRAHPLISVGYFSTWCTLVSFVALLALPSVGGIIYPATAAQWALLFGIGASGFVMQFLMTAGLQVERAGRATNMMYAQMLFALFWERLVWGTTPGVLSICGSTLILGGVLWVGVKKGSGGEKVRVEDVEDVEDVVPLVEEWRRDSGESEEDWREE